MNPLITLSAPRSTFATAWANSAYSTRRYGSSAALSPRSRSATGDRYVASTPASITYSERLANHKQRDLPQKLHPWTQQNLRRRLGITKHRGHGQVTNSVDERMLNVGMLIATVSDRRPDHSAEVTALL